MAGIVLQDWDTSANLEQVSKFNSTNQSMCTSDMGTYPGVNNEKKLEFFLSAKSMAHLVASSLKHNMLHVSLSSFAEQTGMILLNC